MGSGFSRNVAPASCCPRARTHARRQKFSHRSRDACRGHEKLQRQDFVKRTASQYSLKLFGTVTPGTEHSESLPSPTCQLHSVTRHCHAPCAPLAAPTPVTKRAGNVDTREILSSVACMRSWAVFTAHHSTTAAAARSLLQTSKKHRQARSFCSQCFVPSNNAAAPFRFAPHITHSDFPCRLRLLRCIAQALCFLANARSVAVVVFRNRSRYLTRDNYVDNVHVDAVCIVTHTEFQSASSCGQCI